MKPIIIYTCTPCNQAKAIEDEWMRMWLGTISMDRSPAAEIVMSTKVRSSVQKGKFRRTFEAHFRNLELSDVLPSGLTLPQHMTKVHIPDQDFERIRLYVNKVVQGIYAAKIGRPLPVNFGIHTYIMIDRMRQIQPVFKPMIAMLADKVDVSNLPVFLYAVGQSVDSEHCLIATEFYQTVAFVSLIGPIEWIEGKKRIAGVEGSQVDKLSFAPKTVT